MTMNADDKPKSSRGWRIPIPVAIILLLLCLWGGVAVVRWYLRQDDNRPDVMAVDGSQQTGRRGFMGRGGMERGDRPRLADRGPATRPMDRRPATRPIERRPRELPVRENGPNVRAVVGTIELRVRRPDGGGTPDVLIRPVDGELAAAQENLLLVARRVLLNADLAKQLQFTPEQRQKLRQVRFAYGVSVTDKDRATLADLARAWQQASGPAKLAAETKLLEAVKDIGTRSIDSSRQAIQQSADQVKGILTPQQLATLQQMDPKAPIKPTPATTQPATRPAGA